MADDWATKSDGTLDLHNLIGWKIADVGGVTVLVQVQTVNSEAMLLAVTAGKQNPTFHQVQMTAHQTLELAEALRKRAAQLLHTQSGAPRN